jgi:hypothetical protein
MRNSRFKSKLTPRRQFLLRSGYLISGAAFGACIPQTASAQEPRPGPLSIKTNVAQATPQDLTRISLLDTIIPADQSGGAIDLGLDTKLTQEMASQPKTKQWVDRMVHSVSQMCLAQHRKPFHDLYIDQREQLINDLLADRANTITWGDLNRLRRVLLTWYYQSEVGAATIGFYLPAHYPSYPGDRTSAETVSIKRASAKRAAANTATGNT